MAVLSVGFWGSYMLLPATPARQAVADVVHIPHGTSAREIGRLLEERGIVRRGDYFARLATLSGVANTLKAGDYQLSPGMTIPALIRQLERGEVATVRVTIPEGMNARDISALLARRGLVDQDVFYDHVMNGSELVADLLPFDLPIASLEGYLYPDTYLLPPNVTEVEIIRRLVSRFLHVAYPMISEAVEAGVAKRSVHEIVTLASIVEREAMRDEERPIIAGVFANRLSVGQPLQADPTVQYVMEEPRPRLSLRDIAIDSPYNTYKYAGLPPGPIASPGLASLRAALQPADTPFMYFVAKGDGTHVFSETFAEHVAARRRLGR